MSFSAEQHVKDAKKAFADRTTIMQRWQDIADNFWPDVADFTRVSVDPAYADGLSSSVPVIIRTEFGNLVQHMLRPSGVPWVSVRTNTDLDEDTAVRQFLEHNDRVLRRALYDPAAGMERATRVVDHGFVTFGQWPMQVTLSKNGDSLLFRDWHLRDVAWRVDFDRKVDKVWRKDSVPLHVLSKAYGDALHTDAKRRLRDDPCAKIECYYIECPADEYDVKGSRLPFVSLCVDAEHNHVMEAVGLHEISYVIPRWATVGSCAYAVSPCVVAALPEARLLQAIALSTLEAGEKVANPPSLIREGAVRGDLNIYAGGATLIDPQFDKDGDSIRFAPTDAGGLQHGVSLLERAEMVIRRAFFLDKMDYIPDRGNGDVTREEIIQRVQQYVRNASPLFSPMEPEYNGQMCEKAYNLLLRNGSFGSNDDIPEVLRGREIHFSFRSPLTEALEQGKSATFSQTYGIFSNAMAIDPNITALVDLKKAVRDAVPAPASWLRTEEEMEAMEQEKKTQQDAQMQLQQMAAGAEVAQKIGDAGVTLQKLGNGVGSVV